MAASLVASLFYAMAVGTPVEISSMDAPRFYRFLWQDFASLALSRSRNRRVRAHVITMPQSGSHWVNNMLVAGICRAYEIQEPEHIRDRTIIRRPEDPLVHAAIPPIIQSHLAPGRLVHTPLLQKLLRYPKYVLLVRDLRAAMVSHYEKRELSAGGLSFSDYLQNRWLKTGKWIHRDLWHRLRFLNAWARDIRRLPENQTIVLHYEDLHADTAGQLQRLWEFIGLPVQAASFYASVVEATSKERMARRESPEVGYKIVRRSRQHPFEWFSETDRDFFSSMTRRYLPDSFGYDYEDWTCVADNSARAA